MKFNYFTGLLFMGLLILSLSSPFLLNADDERETVVILASEYKKLLEDLADSVFLPHEKYREILEKIVKIKPEPGSPEDLVIESADYDIFIDKKWIEIRSRFKINCLKTGWLKFNNEGPGILKLSDTFLLDGKPAIILFKDEHAYLNITKQGRYDFQFKSSREANLGSSSGSFSEYLILGLGTSTTVTIMDGNVSVNLKNGGIINKQVSSNKQVVTEIINYTPYLEFEWLWKKQPISDQAVQKSRFIGTVFSLYQPFKTGCMVSHIVGIQPEQGSVEKLSILLPDDYNLLEVVGDSVRSYNLDKRGKDEQVIQVLLTQPITESLVLLIRTEKRGSVSELSIIPPAIQSAERQTGFVAITPLEPAFATGDEDDLFRRIDVRELPPELGNLSTVDPSYAYRYSLAKNKKIGSLDLLLQFLPSEEVLTEFISNLDVISLLTADGTLISELEYSIASKSAQFLRLELSEGDVVLSVFVDEEPAPAVHENNDLIIPIRNKPGEDFSFIEVTLMHQYNQFQEEGDYSLSLPESKMVVREFSWELYLPYGYEYDDFEGNLHKGWFSSRPEIMPPAAGDRITTGEVSGGIGFKAEGKDMKKGSKEHLARQTYGAPQKPAAAPAEEREADKSYLVDGVSAGDRPTSTVDLSSSTLSVRLDIPEYGYRKVFNAILMKNEKAVLSFTYEED